MYSAGECESGLGGTAGAGLWAGTADEDYACTVIAFKP